jgi:Tfp pilus assembly protein PilF
MGLFRMKRHYLLVAALGLFVVLLGIVAVHAILTDPDVILIHREAGAEWIRFPTAMEGEARKAETRFAVFRTRFEVKEVPKEAVLSLRAMKWATVWLDDGVLYNSKIHASEWKNLRKIPILSRLTPGVHELRIKVLNDKGHPALLAYSRSLGIVTREHWEVSNSGVTWSRALSMHRPQSLPLSLTFQRADKAFLSKLPLYVPVFALVFIWSLVLAKEGRPQWLVNITPTSNKVRWALLLAWVVLAANNMGKIPFRTGMDLDDHMEYIFYITHTMRIPLATDGWQMFQSPLFYMLSAAICRLFMTFLPLDAVYNILRIIPLLCGILQVELSYRALRYVYPQREDLQALGTVIGGLLPMNIYISQVVGNEPMAACLSGVVIVLAIKLFRFRSLPSTRLFLLVGVFLGFALLTKVTPIILIPPLLLFIGLRFLKCWQFSKGSLFVLSTRVFTMLGAAFVICGWYYIRNWVEIGKPFMGGWDPARDMVWWQDPGFRTVSDFIKFGKALFYPIFSSFAGLWDSLYSTLWMDGGLSGELSLEHVPPWNYDFMLSNAWLSLLPSAAILLGIFVGPWKSNGVLRQDFLFASLCLIIYISAIIYMFLSVPHYSAGKASYALGITPLLAVLSVGGLDLVLRRPLLKATVLGVLICWAVTAYASFFVWSPVRDEENYVHLGDVLDDLGQSDEAVKYYRLALSINPVFFEAHNNLGTVLAGEGRLEEAANHFSQALRIRPQAVEIHCNFGTVLTRLRRFDSASIHYAEALRLNPEYPEAHNGLGIALAQQGRLDEAIIHFSKAVQIKPDFQQAENNLKRASMLVQKRKKATMDSGRE